MDFVMSAIQNSKSQYYKSNFAENTADVDASESERVLEHSLDRLLFILCGVVESSDLRIVQILNFWGYRLGYRYKYVSHAEQAEDGLDGSSSCKSMSYAAFDGRNRWFRSVLAEDLLDRSGLNLVSGFRRCGMDVDMIYL